MKREPEPGLYLLAPDPGVCQACATKHLPEEPHNQTSLHWQYWFYLRNGERWPTWRDAMAHCSPEMQEAWIGELRKEGIEV